ncbi:MAG: DNA-binding protein [Nitrosopumilus sp. B06]|nr:MAG: DNA-binding protein [Nitrosopumilus sp. D6]RNJ78131.1 MAG: DNA-binding protein [Nitrosopumilus sp. B06]
MDECKPISEAKNMRSGVNVEATIKSKGEKRNVNTKSGGSVNVCDAVISDDSGEMKFTLWAEDIDKVKEGDKILITNGYVNAFRGEPSLTKGKFGKMEVNPQ